MKDLIVNNKYNNKPLSKFIFDTFPNLSSNVFFRALRKRDILINGSRINKDVHIFFNDAIRIYIADEFLECSPLKNLIKKIYEDDNILIVDKPSKFEVTGDNSITTILKKEYDFISPCHRIDRNTVGLVIFAKNALALEIMLQKFKNKEIEKHYIAKVYGIPQNKSAHLIAYLFKDTKKSLVYISDTPKTGYSKIITNYTLLSSSIQDNTSILDVNIETGKTHQIRAHLAHIGLPIIGDGKYGINNINKKFHKEVQCLCAYKLIFTFSTNSGILDYLNNQKFQIPYSF